MAKIQRILIAPSILSANFLKLEEEIREIEQAGADWHHIDVMDGHFVPNLSFGMPVLAAIKKVATIPLDVHIMITNPEEMFQSYIEAGADVLTFHIEASQNPVALAQKIQAQGVKAGLAISPQTSVDSLSDEVLRHIDLFLVMTVQPGFGGQTFMPECAEKILELQRRIAKLHREKNFLIEVDGGINNTHSRLLIEKGADCLVCGSYVYGGKNRKECIDSLRLRI